MVKYFKLKDDNNFIFIYKIVDDRAVFYFDNRSRKWSLSTRRYGFNNSSYSIISLIEKEADEIPESEFVLIDLL